MLCVCVCVCEVIFWGHFNILLFFLCVYVCINAVCMSVRENVVIAESMYLYVLRI